MDGHEKYQNPQSVDPAAGKARYLTISPSPEDYSRLLRAEEAEEMRIRKVNLC